MVMDNMRWVLKELESSEDGEVKNYRCQNAHTFSTYNPITIALEDEGNYNAGPICPYCYVDWFKANMLVEEIQVLSAPNVE